MDRTKSQEAMRLLQVGQVGRALVIALRSTGVVVNDNPEAELELSVAVDGREPYRVTHTQVISKIAIDGFRPGVTIPVRIDPLDPNNVLVA
jgi:hypothetical protein